MSTTYYYRAYGLTLCANRVINVLSPADSRAVVDVQIDFVDDAPDPIPSTPPIYPPSALAALFDYRVWQGTNGGLLILAELEGQSVEFTIDAAGQTLRVSSARMPFENIIAYVVGIGLGAVLYQRQVVCLHSSVAVIGQQAILLSGPSGAGKSTTVTALMNAGCTIFSDDLAPLSFEQGRFVVQPGYPRVRLCPDAAEAMFGSADHLPPAWNGRLSKRSLDLRDAALSAKTALPITAVYLFEPRDSALHHVQIRRLNRVEGILSLLVNVCFNGMADETRRQQNIRWMSDLNRMVAVRSLQCPDDLGALNEIAGAILEDVRSLA